MKTKTIIKIAVDFGMTVLLLLLMAFMITGQKIHELLGTGMFLLFFVHNLLNFRWYKTLFKGRYTPIRIFQIIVNVLMLAAMLCLMYSGIIMSRYVFVFLPDNSGTTLARKLHLMSSYWTFMLVSAHIGIHWSVICSMKKKIVGIINVPDSLHIFGMIIAFIVSSIGVCSFVSQNIFSYMTLKTQFVFFDFQQSAVCFFAEYFSMTVLFAYIAYYLSKLLNSVSKRTAEIK